MDYPSGAPWPTIETGGELELAEREWLHTNGAGAYAMSSVALMHSRRYHGLLVASLQPPVGRYVIVSQVDTQLTVGRRVHRLSTHQFPGVAATPGYRLLERFSQDPIPRWQFRLGRSLLEQRLCLARGRNVTVLAYRWSGPRAARIAIRPLLAMRPLHEVTHEHGGMIQRVSLRHGEVEIAPVPDMPTVVFRHTGVFMGSPDWWRRFEYPIDRLRGVHYQEDLWTPGTFEMDLLPDETRYLAFGLGGASFESAADEMRATCQALEALDPGDDRSLSERRLCVAADQFRADSCDRPGIISGYPWLDMGARDALVALPGLYLVGGRIEAAQRVLRTVLSARTTSGLLGRGLTELGEASGRVSADGSLWLFEAVHQLLQATGTNDSFVRKEAYPALVRVFDRIATGPKEIVWLTSEGLLANGHPAAGGDSPLTWMDSRADGAAFTPRSELAVELQALWARACATLALLARDYGDAELEARANDALQRLLQVFISRFWCDETRYPYDCVSVSSDDPRAFVDDSVRPNALMALAVYPDLFSHWQAVAIVERAREQLLTPIGLRTLSPDHPDYRGDFRGMMQQRRSAYHQGTCWPYLLGFFARAAFAIEPDDFELQIELSRSIEKLMDLAPVLGQVAQVGSGDPPHQLGGCPAQAWSVAELLRTLKEQLEP